MSDLKRDVGAPCRSGATQTATADQQTSRESKEDTDKKYRQGKIICSDPRMRMWKETVQRTEQL